jgi:hypothetical protein
VLDISENWRMYINDTQLSLDFPDGHKKSAGHFLHMLRRQEADERYRCIWQSALAKSGFSWANIPFYPVLV